MAVSQRSTGEGIPTMPGLFFGKADDQFLDVVAEPLLPVLRHLLYRRR